MARTWRELFITDIPPPPPPPEEDTPDARRGFFSRLRENMAKSRQALGAELQASVFQTLDDETWERLEEALIMADVGASTTARVVAKLEMEAESGEVAHDVQFCPLPAFPTALLSRFPTPITPG